MELTNVSNLFKPKFVKSEDKLIPSIVAEQAMLVALPADEEGKRLYTTFYNDLITFSSKLSSTPAKVAVQKLIDRKLIYIGANAGPKVKNGIIGRYVITNSGKLAAIVVDISNLGINPSTGETPNHDLVFYTSYYQFIRISTILNIDKIKNNLKLADYLIKYLFYTIMKSTGANLNIKQKEFLQILCSYFYYRLLIGTTHQMAKEQSFKKSDKEIIDDIEILMPRLEKYKTMNDIFKGLVDLNITTEMPASLMIKTLSRLKATAYYSLTSTLDHLIAMSIISIYPISFFHNSVISNDLQTKIESIITPLINSVKFDISTFVKI